MAGAAESCTLSGVNALIIKKVSQPVDAHKRRNLSIFLRLDFSLFLPSFFFFFGQLYGVDLHPVLVSNVLMLLMCQAKSGELPRNEGGI